MNLKTFVGTGFCGLNEVQSKHCCGLRDFVYNNAMYFQGRYLLNCFGTFSGIQGIAGWFQDISKKLEGFWGNVN